MNALLHNRLTDLELPYFLLLYSAVGIVGLLAGTIAIWLCDGTRDDELPSDDKRPDPYEIAYLKGGLVRVVRLAICDMIDRGYLEYWSPTRFGFVIARMVRRSATAGDVGSLTPIQRAAWNWCASPCRLVHVNHRYVGLSTRLEKLCDGLHSSLVKKRLLESPRRRLACAITRWVLSFVLASLGLYKLVTMAIAGRGESFTLILLIVAGLIGTAIICRQVRLSDLGHRYLIHLELLDQQTEPRLRSPDELAADRLLHVALYATTDPHHAKASHEDSQEAVLV
jgi:uncharacterized protein (TIGR04222 family)